MGGAFAKLKSPFKHRRELQKLKKRLIESIKHKSSSSHKTFRSTNSIIMRFPQFKEGLQNIKHIFEKYDEDSNGTIDHEELKKCLSILQFNLEEKEIDQLYHYCDMNEHNGIQYHEFIVLLCLAYLLAGSSFATHKNGSEQIEATFNMLVEAFAFFDKNGDGKLEKKDFVLALNETSFRNKSPSHIARRRFREMDWNKDGMVNFKEFLYSMIKWIGMETDDDQEILRHIEIW
ncbi:hypothetical protein Cni_G23178 [Canna indica]|uniref:EF-hand domain-containing protein n=1 Tax=Canna indica TaxID=4628 RepID=A0AAQ3QM04_9LILI|nr:hypothetical protein Cni_G23178 [Canna indica]